MPLVLLLAAGQRSIQWLERSCRPWQGPRQIIAVEQQGHGRTADIADCRSASKQSADHTVVLMDHLKIDKADFFGFSNGDSIALRIGIRHPNRARKRGGTRKAGHGVR